MLERDEGMKGKKKVIRMGEGEAGIFQRKMEGCKRNERIGAKGRGIYGVRESGQGQAKKRKMGQLEVNRWNRRVKEEGIEYPEYLKKSWTENRWKRMAKYRLGEGMREEMYWWKEEDRKCRVWI